MAKPKLGSGARFKALKAKIAARGGVRNPGAVAAAIGRKKYGKTRFQKMAAKGRKKASGGNTGMSVADCMKRMIAAGKSKAEALSMCETQGA